MQISTAVGLSLVLHAILGAVGAFVAPDASQPRSDATLIELIEQPELPRRPTQKSSDLKNFVREASVPPELLTNEKRERRFSSKDDQTVLEEQRARESGLTANRAESQSTPQRASRTSAGGRTIDFSPRSALERWTEEDQRRDGDFAVERTKRNEERRGQGQGRGLDFSRFGSIERGVSTVGESLPADIKLGDFTALNTDRHLYYTFYARIEEMIRGRWINYVKAAVYGMNNGAVPIPARSDWTTKLEIILDRNGVFRKAILYESSGSRSLDSAPVQAFREARQFPNPPLEMAKEDGQIHLMYAFTVNMIPHYATGRTE